VALAAANFGDGAARLGLSRGEHAFRGRFLRPQDQDTESQNNGGKQRFAVHGY
jgi:hypothetical protein